MSEGPLPCTASKSDGVFAAAIAQPVPSQRNRVPSVPPDQPSVPPGVHQIARSGSGRYVVSSVQRVPSKRNTIPDEIELPPTAQTLVADVPHTAARLPPRYV